MITRCPACGTVFRITQLQLQAREGRARCGRCSSVFDARASLDEERIDTSEAARPEVDVQPAGDTPPLGEPTPSSEPAPDAGSAPPLVRPGFVPRTRVQRAEEAAPEEAGFGPRERPRRSWLWWPASALALVLVAAQAAFHFRGELALVFPSIKPALVELCAELHCDLPLPHRAELMSIESSDLQADGTHPSVMVLSATLRNRAAFPQAFPALELTLTNSQDLAVARRVLFPGDYLAGGARPERGFAAQSELALKVFFEAAALNATGYRLYLFYP